MEEVNMNIPIQLENTPSTMVRAIHSVVSQSDSIKLSLTEVMGYTSHAFRINIRPRSVETDSVYSLHGSEALRRGFLALGFQTLNICPPVKSITTDQLENIIDMVKGSLQRGLPVVGWNLFATQFGLIYGYDDDQRVFYGIDDGTNGPIPYERLPDRRILCLCIIDHWIEPGRLAMLNNALTAILDHAYSRDGLSWDNLQSGLQGYDAWIEALQNGDKISNKGNAFNVHVLVDARKHAVLFLQMLSRKWNDGTDVGSSIARLASAAMDDYEEVAACFEELERMYPYPLKAKGASPREQENALRSIELLQHAKLSEQRGIVILEEMHNFTNSLLQQV